ncbi:hypothetical protein SAMN05421594_3102 [Chryseobacterium oleae]|uniref:Uncharacterized protein n=1 Tax=Chryseobacterium oleae TaxID=491207 RepID=A0A1I4ZMV0_CHROL|nr:hypothetical protein [Chryseobacterium oleae]SFN51518.1 hypothetical protein SAMN05421594_3102 [Chryseobacterium oleae]
MKKTISTLCILANVFSNAQILINTTSSSSNHTLSSPSVLIEFSNNANKGLILPWLKGDMPNPVNGTFIFNTVIKKIKVYINNTWIDFTRDASTLNPIDITLQNTPENTKARVIIGNNTSPTEGILVLESSDKAMVLPKIASPHLNIVNPAPGMIVFDTAKELLCLYNGTQWSFIQKDKN